MRTYTVEHECPMEIGGIDGATCDAPVIIDYETGRHQEDFIHIEDDIYCEKGHQIPERILGRWLARDMDAYSDEVRDRHEGAYWDHVNALIDRARGK